MGMSKVRSIYSISSILFVTILCVSKSRGIKIKFNVSSWKFCIQSKHTLCTILQVSLSACVEACAKRTDCLAVNYFNHYAMCELVPNDVVVMLKSTKENQACVMVKKNDMDITEISQICPCGAGETCDLEPGVSCAVKECRSLMIQNGHVNGNMLSIGASISYECNKMYIATFQASGATCLANGSWSYKPDCKIGDNICAGCKLPRDCQDLQVINKTAKTMVYQIHPIGSVGFDVRCDMDTPPGGWTVIQRRESNSDFEKNWETYKEGFGHFENNFWLGNDKIWKLTSSGVYKLRVDLKDQDGLDGYAEYNSFSIGNESTNFILNVAGHSGTATDSLIGRHNGMMFSTFDQDHDIAKINCASLFKGGWWYSSCQDSNLNGPYGDISCNRGMTWKRWKDRCVFMRFTEMKIRRK